jgi:hypothetical protein
MKYDFLSLTVNDASPLFEMHEQGFKITIEAEYTSGSCGHGFVNINYEHVDAEFFDVPDVKIAFGDASNDLDGLIECMKEAVCFLKENENLIKEMKKLYLEMREG